MDEEMKKSLRNAGWVAYHKEAFQSGLSEHSDPTFGKLYFFNDESLATVEGLINALKRHRYEIDLSEETYQGKPNLLAYCRVRFKGTGIDDDFTYPWIPCEVRYDNKVVNMPKFAEAAKTIEIAKVVDKYLPADGKVGGEREAARINLNREIYLLTKWL